MSLLEEIATACRVWVENIGQRNVQFVAQQFLASIDGRAVNGLRIIELLPHAGILRPLAGEEEGDCLFICFFND